MRALYGLAALLCPAAAAATGNATRNKFYGVYQHDSEPCSSCTVDVVPGMMMSIKWSSMNPDAGKYDFSGFDAQLKKAFSAGRRVTFLVTTGNWHNDHSAPSWLYSHGVPKVTIKGGVGGNPWPYYLDDNYKKYWHAMHAALKQHLDEAFSTEEVKQIVSLQMVFGSTGDVTPWHGTPTDKKYDISRDTWLEYWGNESFHLATVYADWANGGKDGQHNFYLQHHDSGDPQRMEKFYTRLGSVVPSYHFTVTNHEVCKAYQETNEKTLQTMSGGEYKWSHTRLGPDKNYIMSACTQDVGMPEGKTDLAVSQWASLTHALSWGQDQIHSGNHNYEEDKRMLNFFKFFNQYAGYRADAGAGYAGAFASLHDGLDSADTKRFSESKYGKASQSNGDRMKDIVAAFKSHGAKEDDVQHATMGTQASRGRNGMNDCGWDIWPDNYEVFLRQIDPTDTSVGMWRVGDFDSKKAGQYFGRFARRFDSASGKNDMYFAVDGGVFAGHSDAVNVRVVYYDKGTGGWSLQHGPGCKQETSFTKKNTGLWAEATFTITGPFTQSCARSADLVLHRTSGDDTAFAFVELSKVPLVDLFVHP